jgi:transmembrane sensor
MSETGISIAPSAQSIKECAATWLERRVREDWNARDQAELDAWLNESPAHKLAYWRLDAAWDRAERLAALGTSLLEHAPQAERKTFPILRVAAVFAIVAALGAGAANFLLRPQERVFQTPVGGHETVSFVDGSRIELNTDTVLRTRMTTDGRTIWLDRGEAFFQVKHDAAHPFVVMAGDHRITDLGTKFLVRRDPARLEVALLEGRVRLGAAVESPQSRSTLLAPGDIATATTSTMFVTRNTQTALASELGWRRGVLVFRYTPLADAAAEFNRYNRQKLVVADPVVARLTIYGTFPVNDVMAFARVARTALGLRVENHGNEIVILR